MSYLRQVQLGIDYIEARLDEDIPLREVARAAGISQWHFQRIFKALTHETLKTYIRSRRLANALDKLLTTRQGILEIALCAGYDSQEAFTRAFKQAFQLTPNAYRKLGQKSLFLQKVQFDKDYLRHLNKNVSLAPSIHHQPARQLVGLRTHFYSVASEKNNIGDQLPPLWSAFMPRVDDIPHRVPGVCYGVVRQQQPDSDRLEYFAAVEVSATGVRPKGMVSLVLPATTYAVFTHRGAAEQIDRTVNYIYSTWLNQSGKRHTYGADLEIYGAEYDPVSSLSVMGYAIPIQSMATPD